MAEQKEHFISESLYNTWLIVNLVQDSDYFQIRKKSGSKYSITHIKNAITRSYKMTKELYDIILEFYNAKLKLVIEQRELAKKFKKYER